MTSRPAPRSRSSAASTTSRSPARRRQPARSSGSNPMPMVLGGVGVLVVVVVLVMMNSGGGKSNAATTPAQPNANAAGAGAAGAPKAAPVPLADAKAGKAPARPAPPLTRDMLDQLRDRVAEASVLYNEGVQARTAGDNETARDKQAAAKDRLDGINVTLKDQLLWQEEAQLEDWAQPAEYITLEREYGRAMTLTKKIRMGGGK